MKKNLRRIMLLLLGAIAIGKSIYATDSTAGTASLFSGAMKFVFIGAALILLVLILFLSYKLDKEEPLMDNEGAVSKKKLNTANKNKNKGQKKKDDVYSNFSESEEDAFYENGLEQSDFDSEEASGFEEEEPEKEDNLYQSLDDLDEEYEEVTKNNSEYDEESSNLLQEIDDLDSDEEEYEEEEENVDFDTKLLDDLDDYEEPIVQEKSAPILDEIEEDDDDDFSFDTSVLDDLDDYETPNTTKSLASSNMPSTPKTKKFTSQTSNSNIGFRNKKVESTEEIGFRNKKTNTDSSIGFQRKNKKDDFGGDEFLNQMEDTIKKSGTTSKVKKSSTTTTKTKKSSSTTTSKRKKIE